MERTPTSSRQGDNKPLEKLDKGLGQAPPKRRSESRGNRYIKVLSAFRHEEMQVTATEAGKAKITERTGLPVLVTGWPAPLGTHLLQS